jgi:hypothetical protein
MSLHHPTSVFGSVVAWLQINKGETTRSMTEPKVSQTQQNLIEDRLETVAL